MISNQYFLCIWSVAYFVEYSSTIKAQNSTMHFHCVNIKYKVCILCDLLEILHRLSPQYADCQRCQAVPTSTAPKQRKIKQKYTTTARLQIHVRYINHACLQC